MALVVATALGLVAGRVALVRRGPPDGLPWVDERGRPLEVLREREPEGGDRHPLWGVATALRASRTPWVLVAPCDVPHLGVDAVSALVRNAPAVLDAGGQLQPLIGCFPASWCDRAAALATQGAPVRLLAEGAARVPVHAAQVINVNHPDALPARPLLAGSGHGFLTAEVRTRMHEGERGRLAARGILDPSAPHGYGGHATEGG